MRIGRTRGGYGALFAAALSLLSVSSEPVFAKTCRQLEAELASARSGGGGSAQYRKYDRAVAGQREQISIARRQARNAGCGFSFLGGKSACGGVNARIDKMERNLAALERKRTQLAGGGGSKRDRSRILAALDANGCRDQQAVDKPRRREAERSGETASLFDRIFSGRVKQRGSLEEDATRNLRTSELDEDANRSIRRTLDRDGRTTIDDWGGGSGGQFRTLCVRTCDGYYFPMSAASSTVDFDRDQKNCESTCPGTDIQLYYLQSVGEESDAMVSTVTGEPYTALSTAYLYKAAETPRPEGCGCNPAKNFSIIAGNPPEEEAPVEPIIPLPGERPDPAADPETLANAEGGLTAQAVRRILKPKPGSTPQGTGEHRVRVVGPVFLPDPEGAIDLRAPARKKVP